MASGRPPEGHVSPAVTHAEIPSPYAGPAPSPTRTMDFNELTGQNPIANVEPTQRPTLDFQPGANPPGISFERTAPPAPTSENALLRPSMQSSPPPDNGAVASEIAALRAQVGELINGIGGMRAAHAHELEEMRFRMELAAQPPAGYGGNGNITLPPGVNPDDPVTSQQFANFLTQGLPQIQGLATASAIRAGWDVSPAEEQLALTQFPQIASYPEPDRTNHIRRAVSMQRQAAAPPSNGAPHPASTPPAPVTRDARPTVPHPEVTTAPMVGEPPVEDEGSRLLREYAQVERMPTRNQGELKQKLARMRRIHDRMNELSGRTNDMQKQTGFHEVG